MYIIAAIVGPPDVLPSLSITLFKVSMTIINRAAILGERVDNIAGQRHC